jgi:hypothetical protein
MYKTVLLAVDLIHDSSWAKLFPMALGHCFGTRSTYTNGVDF